MSLQLAADAELPPAPTPVDDSHTSVLFCTVALWVLEVLMILSGMVLRPMALAHHLPETSKIGMDLFIYMTGIAIFFVVGQFVCIIWTRVKYRSWFGWLTTATIFLILQTIILIALIVIFRTVVP